MGANNSLCPSGALSVWIEIRTRRYASPPRVSVCLDTRAYINCISPLNGASWLTDCAPLIRFPIIGGSPGCFHFPAAPFQNISCDDCETLYLPIHKRKSTGRRITLSSARPVCLSFDISLRSSKSVRVSLPRRNH